MRMSRPKNKLSWAHPAHFQAPARHLDDVWADGVLPTMRKPATATSGRTARNRDPTSFDEAADFAFDDVVANCDDGIEVCLGDGEAVAEDVNESSDSNNSCSDSEENYDEPDVSEPSHGPPVPDPVPAEIPSELNIMDSLKDVSEIEVVLASWPGLACVLQAGLCSTTTQHKIKIEGQGL